MTNNVKNTTFPGLLDLIAPHSCRGCRRLGRVLCDRCKKDLLENHYDICPNCKQIKTISSCSNCSELPPTFVIGERSGLVGELVQDLKYHSVRKAASEIASLLDQLLPKFNTPVSIVPLPTISKHIRARGLDHTLLVAKQFSKLRSSVIVEKAILRRQNTVQVGADLKTRKKQAQNAYQINPHFKPNNDNTYILLDDVWTTGASMKSAYQILYQAGTKKVILAVLALSR